MKKFVKLRMTRYKNVIFYFAYVKLMKKKCATSNLHDFHKFLYKVMWMLLFRLTGKENTK